MWNEYQRRLERELEEKAKCDRLGVTYDAPGVLKPKCEISADRTAETQQVLQIDAALQIEQPVIAHVITPLLEAEFDCDSDNEIDDKLDNIDWDTIATESEAKLKMLELGISMNISKPQPQVTPLSDVYRESKSIDQDEAKEFNVWLNAAKANKLVSYGYSDPDYFAVVVLADEVTVMPWKEAKTLFGNLD